MSLSRIILVCCIWVSGSVWAGEDPDLAKFVQLANDGKYDKSYSGLKEIPDQKFPYEKLHLKYFALGQWASELKKWPEARENLQFAMRYGQVNAAHIHYLIGRSYKEGGDFKKASESFKRSLDFAPAQNVVLLDRFELSELALQNGKLSQAREHLKSLERRWKGTPKYPEIIWRLMGVELKDNRRHLACRWARKLYSRYPSHSLVSNWGVDLQDNKYEKITVGCVASQKDVRERVRHLNLSGLMDQSRKEIDILKRRARPYEMYEIEMLLVNHLENQGYPDEALQILLRYFEQKKRNMAYQSLLGKVSARAGEFQTAIGAYYDAYKLSPRSKSGKNALFTAAYLSYQIQDYDGATRKFTNILEKFPGSGLARDASWHLAWLQYLKSDYSGSEKSLRALLNQKYYSRRYRRHSVRPFNDDRTRYWLAMSLIKQEKFIEAKPLLTSLANDKSMSFYSLLAKNRLAQVPSPTPERVVTAAPTNETNENGGNEAEGSKKIKTAQELYSSVNKSDVTSEESEESLLTTYEDEDTESDTSEEDSGGPKFEAVGEERDTLIDDSEKISITNFSDPRLRERFQRANNLIAIGLNDWARWELFEIERRTSNKNYLKMLMEAYNKIGSYNRSAYIAEVNFGFERNRKGLKEVRTLWEYCYPRAYEKNVEAYAAKFNVPEPLILAIMRAESQFNKEALSPVGARGLMQVMPYTAAQISKLFGEPVVSETDLLSPDINIRVGTRYLSRLEKKFQDQIPLVAAGYNAGPHRVFSWLSTFGALDMDEFIEHVPYVETRNYIKKVIRNFAIYNELYSHKPATYVWLTQPIPIHVDDRPSPRESWEITD